MRRKKPRNKSHKPEPHEILNVPPRPNLDTPSEYLASGQPAEFIQSSDKLTVQLAAQVIDPFNTVIKLKF